MQKVAIQQSITMPSQNHNSDLEIESENSPLSSEKKTTSCQQKESKKKIEPDESARKSVADASDDSTAANATSKEDTSVTVANKSEGTVEEASSSSSVRERLKRHRVEVAGRVWIPEMWGKEDLLKDWIDCAAFDSSLVKSSIIMSARASLIGDGRRTNSTRLRIENSC